LWNLLSRLYKKILWDFYFTGFKQNCQIFCFFKITFHSNNKPYSVTGHSIAKGHVSISMCVAVPEIPNTIPEDSHRISATSGPADINRRIASHSVDIN